MKNTFFSFVVASCLALGSFVYSSAATAQEHPAQELVVSSTTKMLKVLDEQSDRIKNDRAFLQEQVDTFIVPNLDFSTMAKLALAKHWRKATSEQKVEIVSEFEQLLLNTYTNALTEYSGEKIEFQPFKPEKREDRAVVRSVFKQSGSGDVPVLYKLREKEGWLIYDIEVNNISLVTSYRAAFANEIEKGGIAGLLGTMKERNARS